MGQKQQINSLSKNSLIAAAGDGDIHSTQSLAYNSLIEPRGRWNTPIAQLNDYSNSNNGGVIHSGGALGFDGVNDEVDLGSLGNIRTFSLWVATLFDSEPILDLNGSVHLKTSNGTLNVSGSVPNTIYVNGVPSTTLVTGEFQYVTVVFDQDVPVVLGRLGGFGGNLGVFEASELLFYAQGLSNSEVLSSYNNPQSPLKSGLVAWWDFNELNGLTLFDRSGNGYNASIIGATWISGISVGYQPALAGFNIVSGARIPGEAYNSKTDVLGNTILNPFKQAALNFSGGFDGLYVDAGSAVDTSGAFSFAGWVYVNDNNLSQYIYDNRITDEGQYLAIVDNGSTFDLSFVNEDSGGTAVSVQSAAQNYGQWYFIAMTKGASGATTNLWWGDKNTAPVNKTDVVNKDTGTAGAGTYNLHIASRATKTDPLNGYLLYQLMYTEDLSAANTDLEKIEKIWTMTKNNIPE